MEQPTSKNMGAQSAPEDGISGKNIKRVAELMHKLHNDIDPDEFEVYYDNDYIRIFFDGAIVALLAY